MEIKILGEHLVVTEAIGNYIKEKVSHLSTPDKLNHIEFRIGKEREHQYVRFHAVCPNNEIIILNSQDNNLYRAIDKIMEKIHRSFVKNKERYNTHLHKPI
jgi:putative sigma-54 modulation protein